MQLLTNRILAQDSLRLLMMALKDEGISSDLQLGLTSIGVGNLSAQFYYDSADTALSIDEFEDKFLKPTVQTLVDGIRDHAPFKRICCGQIEPSPNMDMYERATSHECGLSLRLSRSYDPSADRLVMHVSVLFAPDLTGIEKRELESRAA